MQYDSYQIDNIESSKNVGTVTDLVFDPCIDLILLFLFSCSMNFSGYGDDEKGFYNVYNEVFNTIAKEDMEHMDEQESDFEVRRHGSTWSTWMSKKAILR
jgi:DnaJ family protein A protein 5